MAPGRKGWIAWVPSASIRLSREMLSVIKSLISINWPDLTLSTNFCGNGSEEGEREKPASGAAPGGCEMGILPLARGPSDNRGIEGIAGSGSPRPR